MDSRVWSWWPASGRTSAKVPCTAWCLMSWCWPSRWSMCELFRKGFLLIPECVSTGLQIKFVHKPLEGLLVQKVWGTACRDAFLTVSWDCWDTPGQLLGSVHQHITLSFSSAGEDVHLTASLLAAILIMFCRPCTYSSYTSMWPTSVHATHWHTTSPYLNIPWTGCFTFQGRQNRAHKLFHLCSSYNSP